MNKIKVDYWKDKDTVSVPGICKKCGNYYFLNRRGLCIRCLMKVNK